ncbi:MAG: hypothetical protein LBL00_00580, partial [Endomicrobium sp.]|nr:hypothetical protein [Endomicrobium sp.]
MKTINDFIMGTLHRLKKPAALALNWIKDLNALKITALIVVNCFLLTSVYGEAVAVIADNARNADKFKQIFDDFALPYSYGKITSSNFAGSDTVVINIQDLHSHPGVQKNISKIIDTFDKKYGIKNIYLEGSYGQLDTSWMSSFADNDFREQALDAMINSGRLTGAEYYSAVSGRTKVIKGLENEKEYLENLQRFGKILESQDEISVILDSIFEDINVLKESHYNRQQKKLEELSQQYEQGKIEAKKYFTLLYKHTDKLGIDIYKYENINIYKSLLSKEKSLDYKRISAELSMLLGKLKDLLPYQSYKMIVDNTANFSEMDKLYVCLIKLSKEYNINLELDFSALNKFLHYVELSQKINPLELIKEESKLVDEINERFSSSVEERNMVFMVSFQKYLRDFMSSKITADDYEYYEANNREFQTLWVKYIDNRKIELLDQYRKVADEFYKVNIDRNKYFFDNMDGLKNISHVADVNTESAGTEDVIKSLKDAKNIYVVVTGGFHTQGLSEYLSEKGVSNITITPNVVDGIKAAEEKYYQIAKEQSKVLFQALAVVSLTELLTVSPDVAYKTIIEIIVSSGKTDIKSALEEINKFLSANMKNGSANIEYISDNDIKLNIDAAGKKTTYSYNAARKEFVDPVEQESSSMKMSAKSRNPILIASRIAVFVSVVTLVVTLGLLAAEVVLPLFLPVVAGISTIASVTIFDFELGIQSKIEEAAPLAKAKMTETGSNRPDFGILQKILNSLSPKLQEELISKMLKPEQALTKKEIDKNISEIASLQYRIQLIARNLSALDVEDEQSQKLSAQKTELEKELAVLESSLSNDLAESTSDDGIAMYFESGTVHLKYPLLAALFFNSNGEIKNPELLEVFIRHELRHAKFAEKAEKRGSFENFVQRNKMGWLEELVVSLGDLPSFISSYVSRHWPASLRIRKAAKTEETYDPSARYKAKDKHTAELISGLPELNEDIKQAYNFYMTRTLGDLFDPNNEYTTRQQDFARLILNFKDMVQLDMGKGKQGGFALAVMQFLLNIPEGKVDNTLMLLTTKTESMSFRDAEAFLKMINSDEFQLFRDILVEKGVIKADGKKNTFYVNLYHGNYFSIYDGEEIKTYNSLQKLQEDPNYTKGLLFTTPEGLQSADMNEQFDYETTTHYVLSDEGDSAALDVGKTPMIVSSDTNDPSNAVHEIIAKAAFEASKKLSGETYSINDSGAVNLKAGFNAEVDTLEDFQILRDTLLVQFKEVQASSYSKETEFTIPESRIKVLFTQAIQEALRARYFSNATDGSATYANVNGRPVLINKNTGVALPDQTESGTYAAMMVNLANGKPIEPRKSVKDQVTYWEVMRRLTGEKLERANYASGTLISNGNVMRQLTGKDIANMDNEREIGKERAISGIDLGALFSKDKKDMFSSIAKIVQYIRNAGNKESALINVDNDADAKQLIAEIIEKSKSGETPRVHLKDEELTAAIKSLENKKGEELAAAIKNLANTSANEKTILLVNADFVSKIDEAGIELEKFVQIYAESGAVIIHTSVLSTGYSFRAEFLNIDAAKVSLTTREQITGRQARNKMRGMYLKWYSLESYKGVEVENAEHIDDAQYLVNFLDKAADDFAISDIDLDSEIPESQKEEFEKLTTEPKPGTQARPEQTGYSYKMAALAVKVRNLKSNLSTNTEHEMRRKQLSLIEESTEKRNNSATVRSAFGDKNSYVRKAFTDLTRMLKTERNEKGFNIMYFGKEYPSREDIIEKSGKRDMDEAVAVVEKAKSRYLNERDIIIFGRVL